MIDFEKMENANSLQFKFADTSQVDGDTVKRVRKKLGLTQYLFAKLINVQKKAVQKWEDGSTPVSRRYFTIIYLLDKEPKIARHLMRVIPYNQDIPERFKIFSSD